MARDSLIQMRTGTASAWTSANPTLAAGELGVESDTNSLRVGNGSNTWATLPSTRSVYHYSKSTSTTISGFSSGTGFYVFGAGLTVPADQAIHFDSVIQLAYKGTASGTTTVNFNFNQQTVPSSLTYSVDSGTVTGTSSLQTWQTPSSFTTPTYITNYAGSVTTATTSSNNYIYVTIRSRGVWRNSGGSQKCGPYLTVTDTTGSLIATPIILADSYVTITELGPSSSTITGNWS